MPASLPWAVGEWPVHSWLALLSYSLNPLFCEWARLCIRLESFTGKFSLSLSFSPVSLAIHSLGCYFTLAPSDCPQSIQSQSLSSVHNPHLPVQPQLAGAGRQHLGYFSAGFQLGNSFFFFFFLPGMFPSEIPKLPKDPLVRGLPAVWKLLLLHDSFPRMSLFLSFIFCPTSFRREWAAFLDVWCPLPAFRSCFVEASQHSNYLLMNLWWRNWSPCPIPLPSWGQPLSHIHPPSNLLKGNSWDGNLW